MSIPIATNLYIFPGNPIAGSLMGMSVIYTYSGDNSESGTEIRWYKNSVLQSAYNDTINLPGISLVGPDIWYVTVKPKDGTTFGALVTSSSVTIQYQVPTAASLVISPFSPTSSDSLVGSYVYSDPLGWPELGTEIRWYRRPYGSPIGTSIGMVSYNDLLNIPSNAIVKGDVIYFTVRPKNGISYGSIVTSFTVTILNSVPIVSEVSISPSSPTSSQDLTASYIYYDEDGNLESGTEICWYKNDILQEAFNDALIVPHMYIIKGDVWYGVIRPNDGIEFGLTYTSNTLTIGNTAPVPVIAILTSVYDRCSNVDIAFDAQLSYDVDNDTLTYFWDFGDDITSADGSTTHVYVVDLVDLPKTFTVTLTVVDSSGVEVFTTEEIIILAVVNQSPVASSVGITPLLPKVTSTLVGHYIYSDLDGDSESGTEIRWYKNNLLQIVYNDLLTIPSSELVSGDVWIMTVRPRDGKVFGTLVSSLATTIINSIPIAAASITTPTAPNRHHNVDIYFSSSGTIDPDGDPITYLWDFGDGTMSMEANPVHSYDFIGSLLPTIYLVTLTVSDSFDSSVPIMLSVILLSPVNTKPIASGLVITPASPTRDDSLVGSYSYYDVDSDPESGTEIRWYKDDVLQSDYNDTLTIPYAAVDPTSVWYFTVRPNDGKAFGILVTSPSVTVLHVPEAVDVKILPNAPTAGDDLVCSYIYYDADGSPESGTEIRWYKDSILQSVYNDLLIVPSADLHRDEVWNITVTPSDGITFGNLVYSLPKILLSAPPVVVYNGPYFGYPEMPIYFSALGSYDKEGAPISVLWDFGDGNTSTEIALEYVYANLLGPFPYTYNVTLTVTDDEGMRTVVTTTATLHSEVNYPPEANDLLLTPEDVVHTYEDIVLSYTFYDADSDLEYGTEIRWYKNRILQSIYNDLLTVSSTELIVSDVWYATIKPKDGYAFGILRTSPNIIVSSGVPIVVAPIIIPTTFVNSDTISVSYIYNGDFSEDNSSIKWYKNGSYLGTSYDNQTSVIVLGVKDDTWYYTITPKDSYQSGITVKSEVATMSNNPPSAPSSVRILPTYPQMGDSLFVEVLGITDIDGDTIQIYTKWYQNEVEMTLYENYLTIPGSVVVVDDIWVVVARGYDGYDFGPSVSSAS